MNVRVTPGKIRVFVTPKNSKKTASQVRKLTGADVVINGTLFNAAKWVPTCDVKANGKVLSNDRYAYRGLAWNNGDSRFTVAVSGDMAKYDNFISCVFLINEGKRLALPDMTPDVKRAAGRTAIYGLKDGSIWVYAMKEGVRNQTPAQLQATLGAIPGIDYALMLDGGGSTQLSQAGNQYIYSSRRVQNYICFWNRDPEPEGGKPMVEINGYSKAKDGNKRLSAHFKVREFACRDGSDAVLVAPRLVMVLESIRTHFGSAVVINSAYRTPQYNAKEGGVTDSQHCYGTAADIVVRGKTPAQVAAYARQLMPDWGGVGIYAKKGFTHIDVREAKADWTG